ncbi:MAG: hypothetical protein VCB79_05885 [Dehalococcoidia bacterium]
MSTSILTIGHSNHTWESFVSLLKAQEVEVLVDPSRAGLELRDSGLNFRHMGEGDIRAR